MSAREIIMNVKAGDTPVFTLVALDRNGNYTAFFRNTYEDVKKLAHRFEMEAAANILWWLLRRGIVNDDVAKLITKAFSEEDCLAALNTRYVEGRVVSQKSLDTELRISTFDKLNPEADITSAMSEAEKEAHQRMTALKEAAFQGKSTLSLGSGYQHDGGEGTVYSRRNYSLGDTAFDHNETNWSESEDDDDFGKAEWDEEVLAIMKIDISGVHEDLSDMGQGSTPHRKVKFQGKQADPGDPLIPSEQSNTTPHISGHSH